MRSNHSNNCDLIFGSMLKFPWLIREPVEEQRAGPSRRRVRTEAIQPQLRTKNEAIRLRTMSETAQSRSKSEASRPRHGSTYGKPNAGLGRIPQSPISEVTQPSPKSEDTPPRPKTETSRPRTQVYETPEGESVGGVWVLSAHILYSHGKS